MKTITELEHLSYSSISSYLACPRNWAFHYLEQVPSRPSAALVIGSAFHNTLENVLVLGTDELPLVDNWKQQWDIQIKKNSELGIDWGTSSQEEEYNTGLRMLNNDEIAETISSIKPLIAGDGKGHHIEDYVELHVPGVPIPVIGYIDVITDDGIPGDFKTSGRAWYGDQAQEELQPTFYLAALNQAGYALNPEQRFKHYVFVKTKTPKAQVFETTRSVSEQMWLMTMIGDVWKSIEAEQFYPNPTGWKCSPKYCDFWHLCRGKK